MDTELDNFLKRFGSADDLNKPQKSVGSGLGNLKMGSSGVSDSTPSLVMNHTGVSETADSSKYQMNSEGTSGFGEEAGGGLDTDQIASTGAKVASAAPAALGLYDSISGKSFDTSAQGDGPGKGGGAIMKGGADGAKLGMEVAGPWGALVGAAVGAGGTTIAHQNAVNEYFENRKEFNLEENAIKQTERKNDYNISTGKAGLESLIALRKKQLGQS